MCRHLSHVVVRARYLSYLMRKVHGCRKTVWPANCGYLCPRVHWCWEWWATRTFIYDGGVSWIIAVSYYARWFEDSHGGDNEPFHLLLLDDPEERGSMIVRNVGTCTRRDVHKNRNLLPISSNFSTWNVGGCSKVDMLADGYRILARVL